MSDGLNLLAAIMERGSTTTLRLLEEELLIGENEQSAYTYVVGHLRRYGELPTVETVEEETQARFEDTPESVDYYLERVYRRNIYNHARDAFGELRDAVTEVDVETILDVTGSLRQVCTQHFGQQSELLTLSEVADEVRTGYQANRDMISAGGIPTGYSYLDEQTGGYQNGDLIVWVARPGAGKTHNLIHQSRAALEENRSVLFVSMEMPLRQIGYRIASHIGNLNPDLVRKGRLSNMGKRMLDGALLQMDEAHNFHLYAGNMGKKVADLDILIQELAPDAIYIDGIYLMQPNGANARANRYERTAYVLDEIKQITLRHERPVIATTQFGKKAGAGGEDGNLENIGYTDTIATHSSIVGSIMMGPATREAIRVMDDDGEVHTIGSRDRYYSRIMKLLKGREGEAGEWGCSYRFAPTNFNEMPIEMLEADAGGADVGFMEGGDA